jgi:hypothetical protein
MAHPGPPIRYETPNEGLRVELSWRQASIVHEHWPLRLRDRLYFNLVWRHRV